MTSRPDAARHLGAQPSTTGEFVARTVTALQQQHLAESSAARAALARLRRGVGRPVGALPELLPYVLNPSAPPTRQADPTADEIAAYTALTLYAVHQQSQASPMHVPSVAFGQALSRLRGSGADENPGVVRRFQAMTTASSFDEVVHHARGLVTLLRTAGLGFDYGRFARDLVDLQNPRRADGVRLTWGRDFYRVAPHPDQPAAPDATEEQQP